MIQPFSTFVVRVPVLSVSFYKQLMANASFEVLQTHFYNPFIHEAIFLASPELHSELQKAFVSGKETGNEAVLQAFIKYLIRMSSRCTPFGLFAACSTGLLANTTQLQLKNNPERFYRNTELDYHFLSKMVTKLTENPYIRTKLTYFINTTLYPFDTFYRYIKYSYENKKRAYSIFAVEKNSPLQTLIKASQNGLKFNELVACITSCPEEVEEAKAYINQLIDHQILVSELETTVSGGNELDRILKILKNINISINELKLLELIKKEIQTVDQSIKNNPSVYKNIGSEISLHSIDFQEKYLFQTDLYAHENNFTLPKKISYKVERAVSFLAAVQNSQKNPNLEHFKKKFVARYENRLVPLLQVLDTESGIGYASTANKNDTHPILEHFSFNNKTSNVIEEQWTSFEKILEKKRNDCLAENQNSVVLKDSDFKIQEKTTLAPTISVMCEVFEENNTEKVYIDSINSSSANKLLGRFCSASSSLTALAKEIVEVENRFYNDKLTAEIVHIPEDRTGNILKRPPLRNFEIPYLANSSAAATHKLLPADLWVTIRENQVVLFSKKHKKEIIPFLSNAHNYITHALPCYQFLAELHQEYFETIANFSWGNLLSHYTYFPRVYYQDVLLSKETWIIRETEFEKKKVLSVKDIKNFAKDINLPQYINWVNGDNTLLLDLKNTYCQQIFLDVVKKYKKVTFEEFLFEKQSVVTDSLNDTYANQIILSYKI